jgi:orotate phosphoribosyltransferase
VISRLADLMCETGAIRFGEFTLASGRKSDFYLDVKKLLLHPEGLAIVAGHLASQIGTDSYRAVGGVELGPIPLVGAVLLRLSDLAYVTSSAGLGVTGFMVRKQAKEHGTRSQVEGIDLAGRRVALIEDVVTSGGSVAKALPALAHAGAVLGGVFPVVDREEGGEAAIRETASGLGWPVIDYWPVCRLSDLRYHLGETGRWGK